jgi:hypothetical protein
MNAPNFVVSIVFLGGIVIALIAAVRGLNWFWHGLLTTTAIFIGTAFASGLGFSYITTGIVIFAVALGITASRKNEKQRLADGEVLNGYKKCTACAEVVRNEAAKCRYCGTNLPVVEIEHSRGTALGVLVFAGACLAGLLLWIAN